MPRPNHSTTTKATAKQPTPDDHGRSGGDTLGDVHTRRGKSAEEDDRKNDLDKAPSSTRNQ